MAGRIWKPLTSNVSGPLTRRVVLGGALAAGIGLLTGACTDPAQNNSQPTTESTAMTVPTSSPTPPRVLLAYFSRPGENYFYGDRRTLEVGNTEVLARTIARLASCDVYRIEAAEPYSDDYDDTVARNVREQQTEARPALAHRPPSLQPYDVVLLASPIWNVRAPMIMSTFTESLDFTGKAVHPVTTYAMSGLGNTESDYAATCPGATIGPGLAVQGETVGDDQPTVATWLHTNGLR